VVAQTLNAVHPRPHPFSNLTVSSGMGALVVAGNAAGYATRTGYLQGMATLSK